MALKSNQLQDFVDVLPDILKATAGLEINFRMAVEINTMLHYDLRWTPGSYFSLLTWLVLGVGAGY